MMIDTAIFHLKLTSKLHLFPVIMTANYRTELAKYWRNIEKETNSSLEQIKTDSAAALLDGMFKKDFSNKTMTR